MYSARVCVLPSGGASGARAPRLVGVVGDIGRPSTTLSAPTPISVPVLVLRRMCVRCPASLTLTSTGGQVRVRAHVIGRLRLHRDNLYIVIDI